MSVTIHFEIPVPTDAVDVDEILRETLAQTVAFPGNEGVRVLQDRNDPTRLIVDMRWESEDSYASYLAWRQTLEGANRLMGLFDGAPTVRRFDTRLVLGGEIAQ